MKKLSQLFSWTLLSFMLLGIVIGYAAIADTLVVSGSVSYKEKPFEGIYISNVAVHSQRALSSAEHEVIKPTNLQSSVQITGQNAQITYEITVHNNTAVTYWYIGTEAVKEFGSNALINETGGIFITTKDHAEANSSDFDSSDWVPPQTTRVFYVTYSFGQRATGTVSTLVNFNFGLQMDSVHDGFLKILNDKTSPYGYTYLSGEFDKNYKENGSTVLGNVGADADIFRNMFGSNISLEIDGVTYPVTIMIERKDVDSTANSGDSYSGNNTPSGCEYTIYITVDDLSTPNGQATVYAVSYTCGADGYWYQVGELYEGKSTITDYDTSNSIYEGAFDVDTWVAVQKDYTVTDDISYKVGYEQGTQYDKLNTIEELMSVHDQEFYNKVNNNSGKLLKPVCNILYSYTHNNGQYTESENYENKYKQGYDALKSAFDKIKPYCLIANGAQEVKIQNASSLSRAELIQLLEEIQTRYDYYLEVN